MLEPEICSGTRKNFWYHLARFHLQIEIHRKIFLQCEDQILLQALTASHSSAL
jgi:hypothetical protein